MCKKKAHTKKIKHAQKKAGAQKRSCKKKITYPMNGHLDAVDGLSLGAIQMWYDLHAY